jgi:NAD(P)-dependent dehydrogenase (short-subunit alcohol dehydrogenase family)
MLKQYPLGRLGSVRDIADATVYLFSPTGSYVTGSTLVGMYSSGPQWLRRDTDIVIPLHS